MAFSPSQNFFDCTVYGGASNNNRRACESDEYNQKRTEEILKHYFENGDGVSYLTLDPSALAMISLGTRLDTVNTSLYPLPVIQNELHLFFIFFQAVMVLTVCWIAYRAFMRWIS